MTDTCEAVIELGEALGARVLAQQLGDDDLPLIARITTSWLALSAPLEQKDATVARLRKLAFGPAADPTRCFERGEALM